MLKEIRKQFKGKFSKVNVTEIEKMESELLHISDFNSTDALILGKTIVDLSKEYQEDVAIRIVRLEDEIPVFQYMGDSLKQRNIDFAMSKYKTVLKTGHCSMWALVKDAVYGGEDAVYDEDSGCLPAGGAFPIYIGEKMTMIIAMSGLHNGKDQEIIIRALCKMQNKMMPKYTGLMV